MTNGNDHIDVPDDLVAAEYVLGVLNDVERAAVKRRILHERAFKSLVRSWEDRLSPWAHEIEDVAPPPRVWNAVAAALPQAARQNVGLWRNLVFWRISALVAALAAACIGALIYLGIFERGQPLMATIDGGGEHRFVATVDSTRDTITVVPANFSASATSVPELWLIPADNKPRPLGLLNNKRITTIVVPADLVAIAVRNTVLAVSLEPPGGSPTGRPTGPVIATGKLTRL